MTEKPSRKALIVQARLDSTRLPGKALLPLGGQPLITRVMEALRAIPADAYILACPRDSVDAFSPLARAAGFKLFAGSKKDVLNRYAEAIRHFFGNDDGLRVLRATGDNPFVFADAAHAIDAEGAARDADYAGYAELPYGSGIESVRAGALFRADAQAVHPEEREHVCPYLYRNPDLFRLYQPLAPPQWHFPEIRLTVDTPEDYERAAKLYAALSGEAPQKTHFESAQIMSCYRSLFG